MSKNEKKVEMKMKMKTRIDFGPTKIKLPKSLLQAPGGGFVLAVAGSLGWDGKLRCIKNRERDGTSTLGGGHLVLRHNK
jgi:hypothetical protein